VKISERAPFVILEDTRESLGFRFPETVSIAMPDGSKQTRPVQVVRGMLPTGDYTIPSLRSLACVERKAVGDYAQSLTHERERFDRELIRMRRMRYAAIIVEGSEYAVLEHSPLLHRNAVAGAVCSMFARCGVATIFARDSRDAAWRCLALLRRWSEEEAKRASVARLSWYTRTRRRPA
jgi:ERCC4-type nuclease